MKHAFTLLVLLFTGLVPLTATASADPTVVKACSRGGVGVVKCEARILRRADGSTHGGTPLGYGPVQFRTAYAAALAGRGTIAVVAAYNDPAAKADLDRYDATYGLPTFPICTSTRQTACFDRVDQRGGQNFGAVSPGWALETALDTQTVHQLCPACRLELVEADSASLVNLGAAVDEAVTRGARVVSMSWGGPESATETTFDAHFDHPGVAFVASSGDSGYGVSYPAASSKVIAVGGTHLVANPSWLSEAAWSGSGSGCSRYEAKPAWQTDPGCPRRTVADVSADADPATGAAVYSSLASSGAGWYTVGGTSLAAPIVAGLMAGSGASLASVASRLYAAAGTTAWHDIAAGRNGTCAVTKAYLCHGLPGFDGPTGLGSPASSRLW